MNNKQKEVVKESLDNEKKVLSNLKKTYTQAEKDIDDKINALLLRAQNDTENLQSIIYQVDYQKALKKQIGAILDSLNTKQFDNISEYLTNCYENGFIGTLYDLQGQGIPLVFPIDQEQVKKAVVHDTKLSNSLYTKLGEDVGELKKRIQSELSRGIAQGYTYAQIAKNIRNQTTIGYNKASRIARTEGHRIQQEATFDAQKKAKDAGADVVKQWDSALDSRTRKTHALLDGQIRELDDPFEINGMTAMYPGGFGVPSQDIHCRCVVLQRARWALDEEGFEEHTKFSAEDGVAIDLSDAENYKEFKKKYNVTVKKAKTEEIKTNTWTMNPDGTFSKGIVKHEAQYKLDIDDDQVLTLDVTDVIGTGDYAEIIKNSGSVGKYDLFYDSLPQDWENDLADEYNKVNDPAVALNNVLKAKGYKGLNIVNNNTTYQDLVGNYLEVLDDTTVKKTKKSKFETLSASLATQQKKLNKIPNKTYSGIWYNQDVSVSDYSAYKGKIDAKKAWYLDEISKLPADSTKAIQYKKYLDDLDEFEKLGKEYEAIDAKISKINANIAKVKPKTTASGALDVGDAYSQARKDNALWFDGNRGGFRNADKYFDPHSKKIHGNATAQERKGFYTYTEGSGGHNRPLAGFQKPWNKGGTGWEETFYVGPKKVWIDFEGKGDEIRGLTSLIEKSTYDTDVWLQSGQNFQTLEGFLGIKYGTLSKMSDEQLQQFVGSQNRMYSFISTAVNEGGGGIFNGKPMKINFYAPKGSQMLYASDVGAFGKGENEMILQRGGSYKITRMYWGIDKTDGNRRKIFVDMEIHPEEGYDLFQQDPNEWTGSKKNYHS